jgi:hypothetical protein
MRRGGKEQIVFPINQGFMELEQRCWLDEGAEFANAAGV